MAHVAASLNSRPIGNLKADGVTNLPNHHSTKEKKKWSEVEIKLVPGITKSFLTSVLRDVVVVK